MGDVRWTRWIRAAGAVTVAVAACGLWAWQQRWVDRDALDALALAALVGVGLVLVPGVARRRDQVLVAALLLLFVPLSLPWLGIIERRVMGPETWGDRRSRIVGRTAPDFTLEDLHGNVFRLSDHRGKVVVIERWRTWCPPCLEELPYLEYAHRVLGPEGLVVAVMNDEPADAQAVVRDQYGLTFPMLAEGLTTPRVYVRDQSFPRVFIIGRDGKFLDSDLFRGYGGLLELDRMVRGDRAGMPMLPPLEVTRDGGGGRSLATPAQQGQEPVRDDVP